MNDYKMTLILTYKTCKSNIFILNKPLRRIKNEKKDLEINDNKFELNNTFDTYLCD